ncbi:MAG: phosphoenolpyruvate--protein phosphotransferase [Spirochaetaceae bacterium]|nr:phosphoenolpyruvate--protein phosphotransferase [Spirochaetaceae bacterium]
METYKGLSASEGIGFGEVFLVPSPAPRLIPQYKIQDSDIDAEWQRLEAALARVKQRLEAQSATADSQYAAILETYIVMLMDVEFLSQVKNLLVKSLQNIEIVLQKKASEMAEILRGAGDEYLAERAQDITDVFSQVVDELLGYKTFDYDLVLENTVVVADSVSPADAVSLFKKKLRGLVACEGGVSSHLAILARNHRLPAVLGIKAITDKLESGDQVIVDGTEGLVIVHPDEKTLKKYQKSEAAKQKEEKSLSKLKHKAATTKDGVAFTLLANIGSPAEAQLALDEGAEGIGLFRTEFLFMGAVQDARKTGSSGMQSVSENAQLEAYQQVLETMGNRPVVIRTLDAGGDKLIKDAGFDSEPEQNPLLGRRAIRLTLANRSLFKRQLRALYRAGVYGDLRIMIPMVTHLSQIKATLEIIREAKEELQKEELAFNPNVPVGIMVETAAAAVSADIFAHYSDFFSIGTNDLTQYVLGIDRENPSVAELYDDKNVAVLRLIKNTVDSAYKAGIAVSVCGEMAGTADSALLLAGMGVRTLSMSPVRIGAIKKALASHSIEELEDMAQVALSGESLEIQGVKN